MQCRAIEVVKENMRNEVRNVSIGWKTICQLRNTYNNEREVLIFQFNYLLLFIINIIYFVILYVFVLFLFYILYQIIK